MYCKDMKETVKLSLISGKQACTSGYHSVYMVCTEDVLIVCTVCTLCTVCTVCTVVTTCALSVLSVHSCVCLGRCNRTICKHTSLLTSLFRSDVIVPVNLVAETPAILKKCSKVRGTAGPRRARLIWEIAKQPEKKASTSKLKYVSDPVPPVPDLVPQVPDPSPTVADQEPRQASRPSAPHFNQPSPYLQS